MEEMSLFKVSQGRVCWLTWFVVWHVEECPDIERGVGLILEMVAGLVEGISYEPVELFMHILRDIFLLHRPQSLKETEKTLKPAPQILQCFKLIESSIFGQYFLLVNSRQTRPATKIESQTLDNI